MNASESLNGTRGFTLLEMLVAIALGSLVLGLLWSALDQVSRIERILSEERWRFEHNALRLAWFQTTVKSLLPRPAASPDGFVGDAKTFTALAGQPLAADDVARERVAWSIVYRGEFGATQLEYRGQKGAALVVLEWPGDSGRFRYLNAARFEERWPPVTLDRPPMLPTAIVVETGIDGMEVILAAPAVDEFQFPRRADLERQ